MHQHLKVKRCKTFSERGMFRSQSTILDKKHFLINEANSLENNSNPNQSHESITNIKKHSLYSHNQYTSNQKNNVNPFLFKHQSQTNTSANFDLIYLNKKPVTSQSLPKIKSSLHSMVNHHNPLSFSVNNHPHQSKNEAKKIHVADVFRKSQKTFIQKIPFNNGYEIQKAKTNFFLNSPDKNIQSASKIHNNINNNENKSKRIIITSKTKEQLSNKKKTNASCINNESNNTLFNQKKIDFHSDSDNDDLGGLKVKNDEHKKTAGISQAGLNSYGKEKVNQDSFLIIENIFDLDEYCIYGVFDGHGTNGHLVSQYIQKKVSEYFCNIHLYTTNKKGTSHQSTITYEQIIVKLKINNYALIKRFYKQLQNDLEYEKIDINFSGSTCTLIIKVFNKLFISNVGDSRAIIITENRFKIDPKSSIDPCLRYEVDQLTIDHKPEIPKEKQRIEKAGGVISQYEEDVNKDSPMRVWVRGEEYPGIAMSRSIGDLVAKTVGVIPEPDIFTREIFGVTKYIVLCSDGIWEFITNEEVMKIVNPFFLKGEPEEACKELIKKANTLWSKENSRDDITVVIAFIGHPHVKKGTI